MRLVVKFGGTSLANASRVKLAASNISELKKAGNEVLVVVSAMGDTTKKLFQRGKEVGSDGRGSVHLLRLLSSGESQSAALMALAIEKYSIDARMLGFEHPEFPIVAHQEKGTFQEVSSGKVNDIVDVQLDEDESRRRFLKVVEPILANGGVPVIPGFFVVSKEKELVTLGRGGSDITAFLVGRFSRADEVVIVTDVSGLMSADPRATSRTKVIPSVDAGVLSSITWRGAQVLHPNALRYKSAAMGARVVHYRDLRRLAKSEMGTRIDGVASTELNIHEEPLGLMMLVGPGLASKVGLLGDLGRFFADRGVAIHAVTLTGDVIGLYVPNESSKAYGQELHDLMIGEGACCSEMMVVGPIAEITLSNPAFMELAGVISAISGTLNRVGINITEMVTSHANIVVFTRWDDRQRAAESLRERLGLYDSDKQKRRS